jgi:hypothetical protein
MSDRELTIWTLNRADDIVQDHTGEIEALLEGHRRFEGRNHKLSAKFGNRRAFNIDEANIEILPDPPGGTRRAREEWERQQRVRHPRDTNKIMFEREDFDEYFMPIPLKCIGNLRKQTGLDPDAQQRLDAIVAQNEYLSDDAKYNAYWQAGQGPLGNRRMATKDTMGYYEILRESAPNILIGYSQGGLVARYLAYLDEHVFKENLIDGIITIASPNYGSPLANSQNREHVADGLVETMLSLAQLLTVDYPEFMKFTRGRINFEGMMAMLDALKLDLDTTLADNTVPDDKKKEMEGTLGIVATAIKWFGGLRGTADNAFFELNTGRHAIAGSVLHEVNNHPLQRIAYGGVVTMNNNLRVFIKSLLSGVKGWAFDALIGERFEPGTAVYRSEVMADRFSATQLQNPIIKQKQDEYRTGVAAHGIPVLAHDFIIPSCYQLLPENGARFLSMKINKEANHNSANDMSTDEGKQTLTFIKALIKEMKPHLEAM